MAGQSSSDAAYVAEARDMLEGLEALLLDLEANPTPEAVDSVFRVLHTIKGGGGMFGYRILSGFVHHFEEAFDKVRDRALAVTPELIDLALRARDHVIAMLDCGADGPKATALAESDHARRLLAELHDLVANPSAPTVNLPEVSTWSISLRPEGSALKNGMRPDLLIAELAEMGEVEVTIDSVDVPELEALDPLHSYLGWTVVLRTAQSKGQIEGVFVFADDADLDIRQIGGTSPAAEQAAPMRPGEDPVRDPSGASPRVTKDGSGESVRVASSKLDDILDQLGELVIAQSRLSQISAETRNPALEGLVEEVERLVTGLRDVTLSVRMTPIETVFSKFRRVVRDLSASLGKDVVLVTQGGETEIDKNVIDRLSEPLVHMIRNSVDHGIESVEMRRAAGKPPRGTVHLAARQDSGEILITISDDGGGLNTEKIHKKALERGLIAADAKPSAKELHNLIFAPGFSTAEAVSSVSGRGVGMDAVQTAIADLRGQIDVRSRAGHGTQVTLRLPLTLAIIDGLLVRMGRTTLVIPLASVDECVEFNRAEQRRDSGRTMLQIREKLVPFADLTEVFGDAPSDEPRRRVVIVKADGMRLGLVVDDILGQNQTVIKSLSPYHAGVEGFAGATILGDGSVALIIDVAQLARQVADRHGADRRDAA